MKIKIWNKDRTEIIDEIDLEKNLEEWIKFYYGEMELEKNILKRNEMGNE